MLTNILIMLSFARGFAGLTTGSKVALQDYSQSQPQTCSVILSLRLLFTRELPLATSESAISAKLTRLRARANRATPRTWQHTLWWQ